MVDGDLNQLLSALVSSGSGGKHHGTSSGLTRYGTLSRVNGYQEHPIEVEYEWFAKWWTSVRPRPTIDAFSSATDRKLVPHIAPVWFSSRA